MAADNDGECRRRQRWRTTTAADDDGSRDRAADYDGEGRERAVSDSGDSGVAMIAAAKMAAAEDSSGGQRWRTMAADDDGTRDRAADYDGEGRERAANNDGIKRKGWRR